MALPRRNIASGVVVETVSPQELFQVITNAASQDPTLVQQSSERLKEMLSMSGTFDALHEIASQKHLSLYVRQQAIIQFKNAALGHWKARKLLSEEQRGRIRTRCLSFIDEDDETISECNQVIVGKIARSDFPSKWPNVVTDLMTIIDSNLQSYYSSAEDTTHNSLVLRRCLQLLNAILKEFASIKMPSGMQIMAQLTEQLHVVLHNYYSSMSAIFSTLNTNLQNIESPKVYNNILLAHLVFKCLVKIAVWLWNKIDKLPRGEVEKNALWLQDLFRSSVLQLQSLADLRYTIVLTFAQNGQLEPLGSSMSIGVLTRHIRRLQQLSHVRFVELPTCADLVLFYWSKVVDATSGPREYVADSDNAVFPVRFLVQGMVLFKECLAQWAPTRRDGMVNKNALSREFVENAVRALISRFMPLNPSDLETWMNDPEEWVNLEDQENDQWEYEIRPCSERVLVQLSNQFSEFVTPLLVATFNDVAAQVPADLASTVQKEALYCAIGRCAQRLKDVIPFNEWLHQTLTAEAHSTSPMYPIIKRRIAWVIGKWISESCYTPKDPKVWETLVHLLQDRDAGSDTVVRLTAATALRECVDTVDFDVHVLEPFLPTTVSELVNLMGEADTMESKRRIDNTLNSIIEQSGHRVRTPAFTATMYVAFYLSIIDSDRHLGTSAGEDWLFKGSLLVTITRLIEAVKAESTPLGGTVVPLVRESVSPGVISHLDEDGLNLWQSALRNTLTISSVNGAPALAELFPRALELLATNLDLLGKITTAVESYIILDATAILQAYSTAMFRAFLTAMKSDAVTINIKDIIVTLSLLCQVSPASSWAEPMYNSGLFTYLITTLAEGECGVMLLTEYVYLFARIVLADRAIFLQLMSATANATGLTEKYLFEGLLDQWWGKFDSMSEPRHRKLAAIGIALLVSTGRPEVLERLPTEVFNLWLDVFGEIKELQLLREEKTWGGTPSPSPSNLVRYWELSEAPAYYYQGTEGTPEYERRKAIYDKDPVRTTPLSTFVADSLREAEVICGPAQFHSNYLAKADPTVLKQLRDEIAKT
ncbi:armadillo-type protein [Amanita rubescens]|nr:armadillo-type protein [Amanita rubescens]